MRCNELRIQFKLSGRCQKSPLQMLTRSRFFYIRYLNRNITVLQFLHGNVKITENEFQVFLIACFQLLIAQTKLFCQLRDDLRIGFTLSHPVNGRFRIPGIAARIGFQLTALIGGADRKNEIRKHRRIRQEQIGIYKIIQLQQCLFHILVIRQHPVIHAHGKHGLYRIRLFFHDLSCQIDTLHFLFHIIPQWKTLCSYRRFRILRLCHLCKFLITGHKSGHLVCKAVKIQKLTAFPVIIAGQCQKRHDRTIILEAVFMVGNWGTIFIDTHRAAFPNHPTSLKHLFIRNSGQSFDITFIKLLYIRLIFFKSMHILLNIRCINPSVFYQDVSHAQSQSAIGSGIRTKVEITKALDRRSDFRINNNNLHALFTAFFNRSCLGISGKIRIHSPA